MCCYPIQKCIEAIIKNVIKLSALNISNDKHPYNDECYIIR